ncbi:aspartyl protease family protein [Candidatus Daviesbacteria bacterium]|nr:aspartyl protease family protein [Candidatus Daviesbacteria bacterium]
MFYAGLIDSGADYCIFGLDIADSLEIDLMPEHRVKFIGAGGEKVKGFWGKVEIRIDDKFYETKVIFAEIADVGHGILGQQGFFDHFDVKLSYHRQTIEVEPVKITN